MIGQKKRSNFSHPMYTYFSCKTEICSQPTWGHLPQLSAKFEPWMKHLSVVDMKQQYILKLILLGGITLFSTGLYHLTITLFL